MAQASAGQRASQFLAQVGTGGGPVGGMNTPGMVAFGAGDIQRQLMMGTTDYYMAQRTMSPDPVLGAPHGIMNPKLQSAPTMPDNLQAGYVHLNVPGSPLPMYGMMTPHAAKAAQITQDNIRAMDQRMLAGGMPITGQLPMMGGMQAAMGAAAQITNQAAVEQQVKKRTAGRR